MMLPSRGFERYHAHVYFDETSLAFAQSLREPVSNKFNVELGQVHTKPVGPHPCWSYQILFSQDEFDEIIAWLDANRQGLTILLHPEAGSFLIDHTQRAGWLGEPIELNLT